MSNDFIMLKNVRVSFPHLFTKPIINGVDGKYGAVLMLDNSKQSDIIKDVEDKIAELAKTKLKVKKLADEKKCLRDGEDKGRAEYEGYQVISASNNKKPLVINNTGVCIITDEEECQIYAGCYVNAKIRLWAQDNKYGKRINSELVAIQFAAEGEPLDGAHVSVDEAVTGFDKLDEDEDFLAA